jgi:vancomycin permeability regulator SanA
VTRRRWFRRTVLSLLIATVLFVVILAACVWWVDRGSWGHLYRVDDVPPAPVALVLGAGLNADGTPNGFLAARLDLAGRLYERGKVKVLLVSGDNSRPDYDEPEAMRRYLAAHGVPARRVVLDYAGFDTYDSCARANRIFGVRQLIVVTQSYHLDRAVTLCRHLGIDATGVGDDTVRGEWLPWYRSTVREHGACVKAVFDMATGRSPVFLGRHETGVEDALRTGP